MVERTVVARVSGVRFSAVTPAVAERRLNYLICLPDVKPLPSNNDRSNGIKL
jgi:hypothetical protein